MEFPLQQYQILTLKDYGLMFSPDKPDAGPSPLIDVVQIRTDFSTYATVFAKNHTAFNTRNQGDHEDVILTLQTVNPGVNADLDVLYCIDAISHAGTQPQLFVQIPKFLPNAIDSTDAQNTPMQLTYNTVNIAGPQYQSFLPGGYLLYWGVDTGTTVTDVNITDTITLSPAPTQIIVAFATANTMTTGTSVPIPFNESTQITSNSTFIINSTGNGEGAPIAYSFGWYAIAKA
jgi:hypothetical protein